MRGTPFPSQRAQIDLVMFRRGPRRRQLLAPAGVAVGEINGHRGLLHEFTSRLLIVAGRRHTCQPCTTGTGELSASCARMPVMPDSALSPLVMLATSMEAQPGVYALLLGSGVSTGAGIPTGWGVVAELVRRVAAASGGDEAAEQAARDPQEWWAANCSGEIGYASLLAAHAPTAAARQGLLREFFEPSDVDLAGGRKQPSRAHRAIAQLVNAGTVRVIVTTNFDRLIEQALQGEGVSPQVIARPEAVAGMAPLAHAPATIIKLHGDYLDLGTRNTPTELADYPKQWTALLAQVFDEYGLVVCGWSADWDTALVQALEATPNRRYPLYWDGRSSKGVTVQRVLANRRGVVIGAGGADELFGELADAVKTLNRLAEPPLTTAMALARLKRCLPDPVRRIELHDLVMDAVAKVAKHIAAQPTTATLNNNDIQGLWESHLAAVEPLTRLLITGLWHDPDGVHDQLWVDAVQRLIDAGTVRLYSYTVGLDDARLWPALIAVTAMGVAAVHRGREQLTITMASAPTGRGSAGRDAPSPAGQLLHPERLLTKPWVEAMPRWGGAAWTFPSSHLLQTDIADLVNEYVVNKSDYVEAFHGFENRLGLVQERQQHYDAAYRALPGEYVGERGWTFAKPSVPLAEVAFRAAIATRSMDPWGAFIDGPVDQALTDHREILEGYRGRG